MRIPKPGRVPSPLAALLLVATIQAAAWAIVQPPMQGPDEVGHVAYVQKIVDARTVPWDPSGGESIRGSSISDELATALAWGGVEALQGNLAARPPGTEVNDRLWSARDDNGVDRENGGFSSTMATPPAYYLYAAVPYAVLSKASIFDRAFAVRLWSIPLLLAVVSLTWLIAGELFGGRRWAQTVAAAVVALNPQSVALGSVANPESMLAAAWSAFFYLAIVSFKRGPTRWRTIGLVAAATLACLTHARGVAIVIPLAVTLALLGWRRYRPELNARRLAGLGVIVAGLGAVLGYAALRYATLGELTAPRARQFVSYLWQFYLPSVGSMLPPPGPQWDARDVFVDRWFGGFVQFDVGFSVGTLDVLAWVSLVVLALAVAGLIKHREAVACRLDVVAVVAVGIAAYLFQLHLAGFRSVVGGSSDPVLTGRYLLPFSAVYGGLVVAALLLVPRRALPVVLGVALGALVVLGLGTFGLLVERFYA